MRVAFRITRNQTNSYLYGCCALPEGYNPVVLLEQGLIDDLIVCLLPLLNPFYCNALNVVDSAKVFTDIAVMDKEYSFSTYFTDAEEFKDLFKVTIY